MQCMNICTLFKILLFTSVSIAFFECARHRFLNSVVQKCGPLFIRLMLFVEPCAALNFVQLNSCTIADSSKDALIRLDDIEMIGSGGGGVVIRGSLSNGDDIAVMKISNAKSILSVQNECRTLKFLKKRTEMSDYFQQNGLKIEDCLATCSSIDTTISPTVFIPSVSTALSDPQARSIIIMKPFFQVGGSGAVSTLAAVRLRNIS